MITGSHHMCESRFHLKIFRCNTHKQTHKYTQSTNLVLPGHSCPPLLQGGVGAPQVLPVGQTFPAVCSVWSGPAPLSFLTWSDHHLVRPVSAPCQAAAWSGAQAPSLWSNFADTVGVWQTAAETQLETQWRDFLQPGLKTKQHPTQKRDRIRSTAAGQTQLHGKAGEVTLELNCLRFSFVRVGVCSETSPQLPCSCVMSAASSSLHSSVF